MNSDLVSILIPTFNRATLIAETIRAALNQTYESIEVVVVDNASTDGTWDIVQSLAASDARVRPFRNESNIGPVRNWIACAVQARGRYSKILWSDDLITPDFLSRTIPLLQSDRVAFVYTAARIFRDLHSIERAPVAYNRLPTGRYATRDYIRDALVGEDLPFSPGCAVFRTKDLQRNLLEQVPNRIGSDFSLHAIGNDFLVFLLTAKDYPEYQVIDKPLSLFRDHPNSISTTSGVGRLILHYDVARAYFAQEHVTDKALLSSLNAMLRADLRRYDGRPYGLREVQDFYPRPSVTTVGFGDVAAEVLRVLRRKLNALKRRLHA